jgi:hypothetical protein
MRATVVGAGGGERCVSAARMRMLSTVKLSALLFAIGVSQIAPLSAARAESAEPQVANKKLTDADLDALLSSGSMVSLNSALKNYGGSPSDFKACLSSRYGRSQLLSVVYYGSLVRRSRATSDPDEALRLQREALFVYVFIVSTAPIDYAKCADRSAGAGLGFLLGLAARGPRGASAWDPLKIKKSVSLADRDVIADRVVKLEAETADDRAKSIEICGGPNARILSEAEYRPAEKEARARLKDGVLNFLELGQ